MSKTKDRLIFELSSCSNPKDIRYMIYFDGRPCYLNQFRHCTNVYKSFSTAKGVITRYYNNVAIVNNPKKDVDDLMKEGRLEIRKIV